MPGAKVVMVEGKDDEHVIYHLCGNRGIEKVLKVEVMKNVENLLESIPVRLKATQDGDIVGIVLDADLSPSNRWAAVRQHLQRLSYPDVPLVPTKAGTIIDAPVDGLLPRVGVWMMPNNQLSGMLEDFLSLLVPAGSTLFERVKRSVDDIPKSERLFPDVNRAKAIIHTWLAWQEDPGLPFGTAITARFLDPDHKNADDFISWLRLLFRV